MPMRRSLGGLVTGAVVALVLACGGVGGGAGSRQDAAGDGATSEDSATSGDSASDAPGDGPTDAGRGDANGDAGADADAGPTCTGTDRVCAPSVPGGWALVGLYAGSSADAVPDCVGGAAALFDARAGLVAPPATCSSCEVGAPASPGFCAGTLSLYPMVNCAGAPTNSLPAPAPTCSLTNTAVSMRFTPQNIPGTCPPAPPQVPVVDPPVWQTSARGCDSPAVEGACGSGLVCVTKPAAPLVNRACVWNAGDVACPNAAYADRHVYYQGYADARDCSACAVAYEGDCTQRRMDLRGGPGCSGATVPAAGCVAAGPQVQLVNPAPANEKCAASGGAPTGVAVANQEVTVCCTPP